MILLITPLRSTFCKLFITEAKRYHQQRVTEYDGMIKGTE